MTFDDLQNDISPANEICLRLQYCMDTRLQEFKCR